jgi:hypothetical protein
MNLRPAEISALRDQLLAIDDLTLQLGAAEPPIQTAQAAAARLRQQLADLDRQTGTLQPTPIAADAQRLEALLAGDDVPHVDKKDIEASAVKTRLLAAQRQQITADIGAIERHLGSLHAGANALQGQIARIERDFAVALGTALFDAYSRDITDFVTVRMPELRSVPDEEYNAKIIGTPYGGRSHTLWPRPSAMLSGEPSSSPKIVDQLIAAVRASPDLARADVAQAAT